MVEAVLFDLDGVITATSELHYLAWKRLAKQHGIEIDREFNETLKGVDRKTSLERILALTTKEFTSEQFDEMMQYKNDIYVASLESISKNDLLPGIEELLKGLRQANIKISIASASKNAPYIINRLEIGDYIDYIANPEDVAENKPAPDIFLLAAKGVNATIENCVAIEDAEAGVEAIIKAGAKSVAIGLKNSGANIELNDTSELNVELINSLI